MNRPQSPSLQRLIATLSSVKFFAVWSALALLSYFFFDKTLTVDIHAGINPILWKIDQFVTQFGKGTYYIIAAVIIYAVARLIIKKERIEIGALFFLYATIIPGLVCDLIKMLFGRARPTELFHHSIYGFQWFEVKSHFVSFPSGHATLISGVMMGLIYLFPRYWVGFFSVAAIVSFSRVIAMAHYLSDVMMGMYLGMIVVIAIYNRMQSKKYLFFGTEAKFVTAT